MFGYFLIQDTVSAVFFTLSIVIVIRANYDFLTKYTNMGINTTGSKTALFSGVQTYKRTSTKKDCFQ